MNYFCGMLFPEVINKERVLLAPPFHIYHERFDFVLVHVGELL